MKSSMAICFFSLTAICAQATIRTVSNDPQNPAQFTTIQAAVNAASPGDTIYVHPSTSDYNEGVQIPKRLVLIGGGYKSSNQLNFRTEVNAFNLTASGGNNASGTVITGFFMSAAISANSSTISNILIFRNRTTSITVQGSNWTIYNNVIVGNVNCLNALGNIQILNNIFSGGGIGASTIPTLVIDHNVFLRGSSGNHIVGCQAATFTNNIFVTSSAVTVMNATTINNNFNNNLSLLTNVGPNAPTNSFAGGPNTASGNFVGVNPGFANVPGFGAYDENANYRLQTSSPVRNAGTDGTDLGIYGGTYPFPSRGAPGSGFDTSALPPVPQITSVNIENGTVAPGAQLRVTIQAATNN